MLKTVTYQVARLDRIIPSGERKLLPTTWSCQGGKILVSKINQLDKWKVETRTNQHS